MASSASRSGGSSSRASSSGGGHGHQRPLKASNASSAHHAHAYRQQLLNFSHHAHHHGGEHLRVLPHSLCSRPRTCMADAEHAPLLVFHPQGGLGNCLFGLSSAALLATALCRRFGLAWGHNVNRQAGASYSALFQRAEGLAFVNETEGKDMIAALGGAKGSASSNCTLQLNVHFDSQQSLAELVDRRNLSLDASGKVKSGDCPVLHVRSNMYIAPVLERNPHMVRATRWLRARGLGCGGVSSGGGGGGGSSSSTNGGSGGGSSSSSSSSSGGSGGGSSTSSGGSGLSRRSVHSGHAGRDGSRINGPLAAGGATDEPFFAGLSRRLFVPKNTTTLRTRAFASKILNESSVAVIGVHVRSTLLLALHKERRTNATANGILRTYGFLDCIASVRSASAAAGYASSRVYVAADNPMIRTEATAALGEHSLVPPPAELFTGREQRGKMTTIRGMVATMGAVDEMLLLSRLDGLVIWDLKDSTYSAVSASWAAHQVGVEPAERREQTRRPWLGVHVAASSCARLADAEVEPPAHEKVAAK